MHTLLHAEGIEATASAPAGVFLNPAEALPVPDRNFTNFSDQFWIRHQDVIVDGTAIVFRGAVGEDGQLMLSPSFYKDKLIRLGFDCRGQASRKFGWELTEFEDGKAAISQLIADDNTLTAYRYELGNKRELRAILRLDEVETIELADAIRALAGHEFVKTSKERHRTRKKAAEYYVGKAAIAWGARMKPENYDKTMAEHDKRVDSIGFETYKPFEPTAT